MEALMQGSSWNRTSILALGFLMGFTLLGCTTQAIATQECRDIEYARCEASVACGVVEQGEVEACKRFYREQCFHGIAGPEAPTAEEQTLCVEFIEAAGDKAQESLDKEDQQKEHELACTVISAPWKTPKCAFLRKDTSSGGAQGDSKASN